jgi:hypothetical protein
MKLIPILFSTPMVQAILAGRKTKTRRQLSPYVDQPNNTWGNIDGKWGIGPFKKISETKWAEDYERLLKQIKWCPYGQPGDVHWVRESFYAWGSWHKNGFTKAGEQKWRFADTALSWKYQESRPGNVRNNYYRELGWYKRNSIHMPFTAARIFLKVKSIRVERLQDISKDDAIAEGIEPLNMSATQIIQQGQLYRNYGLNCKGQPFQDGATATDSFFTLWQSINGIGSVKANPWVWVIEFERTEKPSNP